MNRMQSQVTDFHRKGSQVIGKTITIRDKELRMKLIKEEAKELLDAIEVDDIIEMIDGACDLIYVVMGTMVSAGIDLQPYYEEVQRSNMAKVDGPGLPIRDENGKISKPPGWIAPDIKGLFEKDMKLPACPKCSANSPMFITRSSRDNAFFCRECEIVFSRPA